MATPSTPENPHRVSILRDLEDDGIDPVREREAVCHDLRDRGYDDFADYLGRLPERTYRTVIADVLDGPRPEP